MSLYLPKTKTLTAGDATMSENGTLTGPMPSATPNMEFAIRSLAKFLAFEIETIDCYHGGLVTDQVQGRLRRVAS